MGDGKALTDALDQEIERVNSAVANSRSAFRKNVNAHIINWRAAHERLPTEALDVVEDVCARCDALAEHLDRQGLRHDDDTTRSRREAAKLSVQRMRDAFRLFGL